MDKEQIIRAMRAGRAGIDVWDKLEDEVKDRIRVELGRMADGVLGLQEHPAHPAIPEEVHGLIAWLIEPYFDKSEATPPAGILAKVVIIRDWLAKCHQASDKAVCPKCRANCHRCGEYTPFSPPREPKKGSENV